jgi:chorismate dehydratase
MNPVRIACVEYLNTVPLIEGLEKLGGVELQRAAPSRIVDLLTGGRADIGLVSLIDAARSPTPLTLLAAGMIGCDGPTMTVRIFAKAPLDQIRRLRADTDSHTSVALASLLLKRLHGIDVEIIDYDAREDAALGEDGQPADATLLIGDKVVTQAPSCDDFPHQLDLGDAWKQLTGLPFVYAVWMCRAGDEDDPAIQAAAAALDRARRHNALRMGWIVSRRAEELRWPRDLAERYLGELLRFEVGPREREAAQLFLNMCADAGLAPRSELRWAAGRPAAPRRVEPAEIERSSSPDDDPDTPVPDHTRHGAAGHPAGA